MFFEKSGRLLFAKIRLPFFLLLLILPPLFSALYLFSEMQTIETLQERFFLAMKKGKTAFARKERKEKFLARHSKPDPYFLDKEIESLSFLTREQISLKQWLLHPAISQKTLLAERLHFLQSGENRLSFAEEEIHLSNLCKETVEKQRTPVELDEEDLKSLLCKIEEIPRLDTKYNRPQLLITNFSLHKKATPLHNEVFEIQMELLKREFLP